MQKLSNFMKICPVGDELFYADRRTDRLKEANSRFSQFYEFVCKITSLSNLSAKKSRKRLVRLVRLSPF